MATTPSLLARITAAPYFQRVKSWAAGEGQWRPMFGQGELGTIFDLGATDGTGYQRNLHPIGVDGARFLPMVYACVMANARAASTCWPKHMRESAKGKKDFEQVTTSPAFRVFQNANDYETWPVFLLNMIATHGFEGQAYALLVRDDRGAVRSMHRMPRNSCSPRISPADGSIYYAVGANPFLPDLGGTDYMVPARDVWHLRQHCPRHPLLGESPATAAAMQMNVNVALSQSQAVFFSRMSRPSGVLVSDQQLNDQQMVRLRANWAAQTQILAQGGVPILGNGVKWQSMGLSSENAQMIEAARFSGEDIARVFGVPLPVVGELSHATISNVEQLVGLWLSTGLTSLLELIERDLNNIFTLDGFSEFIDLDEKALMRTDFAGQIDALCKGIQGGLFMPNEARAQVDLPPVAAGNKVYAQAQMQELGTKLSGASDPNAPAPPAPPAPAPGDGGDPADPNAPPPPPAPAPEPAPAKQMTEHERDMVLAAWRAGRLRKART